MKDKTHKAIRVNITPNAVKNIKRVKATLSLKGKELTQEQTIDFMLSNYVIK